MKKYTVEIRVNGELEKKGELCCDYIGRLLRTFNNLLREQEIKDLYEEE